MYRWYSQGRGPQPANITREKECSWRSPAVLCKLPQPFMEGHQVATRELTQSKGFVQRKKKKWRKNAQKLWRVVMKGHIFLPFFLPIYLRSFQLTHLKKNALLVCFKSLQVCLYMMDSKNFLQQSIPWAMSSFNIAIQRLLWKMLQAPFYVWSGTTISSVKVSRRWSVPSVA